MDIVDGGRSVKSYMFAAALLLGSSGLAFAADPGMPMDEPPIGFNWTGGYAGFHLGYGWGDSDFTDDDGWNLLGQTFGVDSDGVLGGIQAGYNWQTGSLIVGVEGELGYLNLDGSGLQEDGVFNDTFGVVDGGFYTGLSARVGYAMDRTLLFAKAGGAYHGGEFSLSDVPTLAGPSTLSGSKTVGLGYQIGAGVEHAVTDNWTLKVEYAYFDFGSETVTGFDEIGDPYNYTADLRSHTIKVGVNFKF